MAVVIAYGTEKQAYFNLFLQSCQRFGIEPVLLGWGDQWAGTCKKLRSICRYIRDLPGDEIILSVDPFDVIFLAGTEEIEARFREMSTPFLCGALKLDAFNAMVYDHEFNRTPFPTPGTPTEYNFLNAGTWISTAGYAYRLLKGLMDSGQLQTCHMDQEVFTAIYVGGGQEMDIDWNCHIFHNILFTNFVTRRPDMADIEFTGGRIRNSATGTMPSLLHASGNVVLRKIACSLGYASHLAIPEKDLKNYTRKAYFHLGKILKYAIIRKVRIAWT